MNMPSQASSLGHPLTILAGVGGAERVRPAARDYHGARVDIRDMDLATEYFEKKGGSLKRTWDPDKSMRRLLRKRINENPMYSYERPIKT